jgi:DNA replication ATP-dependent helicase Dna2
MGALRFAPKFILVGDERQLPPLVMSEDAARMGLRESLFARLRDRWGESASTSLRVQYRMHPIICQFPSDEFYGGRLVAAAGLERDLLACARAPSSPLNPILMPERPAVFIDVPEPGSRSRISMLQAHVVARTTRALLQAGVLGDQIGIIAPYRAQVAAIRQRLDTRGVDSVSVDTVDRFQGAERDVILLVLGGTQESRAGQRESFVADPHRLNVALTRARKKLIIVGEQRALRQNQRLARLLSYQEALYGGRGGLVTARIAEESAT